ncbi:hypothetical protein MFRU_018g00910 [Monilinia fructicola]|nr:hypothetical protein MFRU_018g00910 [Monilinia fructicola]
MDSAWADGYLLNVPLYSTFKRGEEFNPNLKTIKTSGHFCMVPANTRSGDRRFKDELRIAINYNDSAVRVNHENCALNVEHTRNNWIKNTGHYLDGQFAEKELRTTYDDPFFDALSFDMRVAHAGLNPTAEIEQQHEIQITSLKYIDLDRKLSPGAKRTATRETDDGIYGHESKIRSNKRAFKFASTPESTVKKMISRFIAP